MTDIADPSTLSGRIAAFGRGGWRPALGWALSPCVLYDFVLGPWLRRPADDTWVAHPSSDALAQERYEAVFSSGSISEPLAAELRRRRAAKMHNARVRCE